MGDLKIGCTMGQAPASRDKDAIAQLSDSGYRSEAITLYKELDSIIKQLHLSLLISQLKTDRLLQRKQRKSLQGQVCEENCRKENFNGKKESRKI